MIVYNVTIKIDLAVHDDWLYYMKHEHILDVMNTGHFEHFKFFRLMEQDEKDGITYAIQYYAQNMSDYFAYQNGPAEALQADHSKKFKDKFVAFRTLMREI